jgi:acyl transferase domain-containing protein
VGQPKLEDAARKAVAIVGVGAVMPDAPDAAAFWQNIRNGHSSIREIPSEGYWDPALYYDPDPKAPDKSYTTIGGFATNWAWEPLKWKLPIPPKVSAQMDRGQKWAIMSARQALMDYGLDRPLNKERTGVILGNAMAGDLHYYTATRILTPEIIKELQQAPSFASLPADLQARITEEVFLNVQAHMPPVNEDTMPGELSNIIAGRVAAMFDLHGPNFVTDAACASAMAAVSAACEGLTEHRYDAVLSGGVDANMNPSSFIKFCKIGALSATGSRPFDGGADGFVMGEGAALFLMKRLADAERDGDKIYAVIRGIGGSSDGKGKGITAPNPAGQQYAIARGWDSAGLVPNRGTMIEGHGTSTRVGDVAEGDSLIEALSRYNLDKASIPLGSVKSNIGHLKAGAGAAGLFKAVMSLHEKVLPPSLNFQTPNPKINFAEAPFYVNASLQQWDKGDAETRTAGVSSFGFGGTNFHIVAEEHVPGRLQVREPVVSVPGAGPVGGGFVGQVAAAVKEPLRGALVLAGATKDEVLAKAKEALAAAESGQAPPKTAPKAEDLRAEHRLVVDYGDAAELSKKLAGALRALGGADAMWKALKAQGIFYRSGKAPKVAFLYTGQGSQYVNMMRQLRDAEPIVRKVFEDADETMTPLLGKPLTDYIYVDAGDKAAVKQATMDLMQTAITQPAVLATDQSLTKLMKAYGVEPDMVMGHSLGEYGALVACGALPFADALEAVSARGREMTKVSVEDCGLMAAVFAPIEEVQQIVDSIDGYAVIANINSGKQAVIGGSTPGVKAAVTIIEERGYTARMLPVSHAFHTSIVAPASGPLQEVLRRLDIRPPQIPLVANTTGNFYPMHPGVEAEIVDILGEQIASPVQFVKGLHTLYEAGCRVFVEMGPKKALHGFVEDVLGEHSDVLALFSNHPKQGDIVAFNQALCGLYAAGLGIGEQDRPVVATQSSVAVVPAPRAASALPTAPAASAPAPRATSAIPAQGASQLSSGQYQELGQIFADFIDKGLRAYAGGGGGGRPLQSVVITGAAVGLPGLEKVFDDRNVERLLAGQQLIGSVPPHLRQAQIDKRIVRLVKDPITGSGKFVTLDNTSESIKLGGRVGTIDLPGEFGYPKDRMGALDVATELVIGAGIQALRDAGIPLVRTYKTTTKGTFLPDRWMLPESMRDETGVIFGSAFPGYEAYADEMRRFYEDRERRTLLAELEQLRARIGTSLDLDARIEALRSELEANPFNFDRRFVFKILAMGHSQFAEYIGARGPNTQINAACASGTQGIGLAQDWIQSGRCRRVLVVSSDSVTSDNLMEWIGSGFLASGAAATDEVVEEAALPFDRRRHGLLLGAGGAAVVVESAEAAAERGVRPVTELLETSIANSAFHGSRLDVQHVAGVIEDLVARAERRWGVSRHEMAEQMVFVSHETFTPARGGSAQAEVNALRQVFGPQMDKVVVANTKGLTGHAMGTGIEDVLAVKALETGVVPPVPNYKEVDPELGTLNLAKGGTYPIHYALRLAAGFGSQVSITLQRWIPSADGRRPTPQQLGFTYRTDQVVWNRWLSEVTGYDNPELEVIKQTLRVKEQGPPKRAPKPARPMDDIGAAVPAATVGAPAPAAPRPVAAAAAPRAVAPAPAPKPAPAPVAAAPTPAPAPAAPAVDPVVQQVLGIVAEQTGYPTDMLDLRARPRGRPGHRHGQAGRDLRRRARGLQHRARGEPAAARLPHAASTSWASCAGQAPRPRSGGRPPSAPAPPRRLRRLRSGSGGDRDGEGAGDHRRADRLSPDMLDLELDLEADLGIDTVKQAETFAAVREAFSIPRDENLQLRDFPTLEPRDRVRARQRPDLAPRRPTPAAPLPGAMRPAPAVAGPRRRRQIRWRARCWRSSPRRPATRRTCSTWISTSRPTWGSTR